MLTLLAAAPLLASPFPPSTQIPLGLERKQGVSMGVRILHRLVEQVESLCGAEAVEKLTIVLHLNDQQAGAGAARSCVLTCICACLVSSFAAWRIGACAWHPQADVRTH